MTTNSDIQHRGNCQVCGRPQAVTTGVIAKHGYTVDKGWFSGTCSGSGHVAMQTDISLTTTTCSLIRADCDRLDGVAADLKAGTTHPVNKPSRFHGKPPVMWADMSPADRKDAVAAAIWGTESRARHGRSIADALEKLGAAKHNTAFLAVRRDAPAKPICRGDVKLNDNGLLLTALRTEGARVYYTFEGSMGNTRTAWQGTQSWRRLVDAPVTTESQT